MGAKRDDEKVKAHRPVVVVRCMSGKKIYSNGMTRDQLREKTNAAARAASKAVSIGLSTK